MCSCFSTKLNVTGFLTPQIIWRQSLNVKMPHTCKIISWWNICAMAIRELSCTISQMISNNIILLCVILHYFCSLHRWCLLMPTAYKSIASGWKRRPWGEWADRGEEADKCRWDTDGQAVEKLMSFNPQTTAANLRSGDLEEDWGGVLSITGDHR